MTSDASPRSAAPLNAFQHLKTTNLAVLEASVRRFFPGARFEISNSVTKLDAVANRRRRDTENLRRLFMFLVDRLDSATSSFHPLALAELEQAVIVSFLMANDSNHSLLLRRPPQLAAPWQVRRAEFYIEANWDQPLTIEALALVTGVSARTLFHSFRKSRGYSPMHFVRQIRLDHARQMLRDADESTSVTTVAFACGFGNLGHFSNYYRQAFGETPSATLRRSHPGSAIKDVEVSKSIKNEPYLHQISRQVS